MKCQIPTIQVGNQAGLTFQAWPGEEAGNCLLVFYIGLILKLSQLLISTKDGSA